jgi:hypothetical protein
MTARLAGLLPGLGEFRPWPGLVGGGRGSESSTGGRDFPIVPEEAGLERGCSGSSDIVGAGAVTNALWSVYAVPGPRLMIGLIADVLSLLDLTTLSPMDDGVGGTSRFSLSNAWRTADPYPYDG